jgi:hypothetical protein
MPITFLIKDILNNDTPTECHQQQKRTVSPMLRHNSTIKKVKLSQQHSTEQDIFMSSLMTIANQQQYQPADNTEHYIKSPQSSSSSSSSSLSPVASSTQIQFSHEQLVNQFYQRLLFLNLQNSLNRIQTGNLQGAFSVKQQQQQNIPSNKENNIDQQDFCDTSVTSEYDLIEDGRYSYLNFHKKTSEINKSFSTSSLKISDIGEFDESNSDSNGNCSTPLDNNNINSNVSPLDALLQMANTTFINNHGKKKFCFVEKYPPQVIKIVGYF